MVASNTTITSFIEDLMDKYSGKALPIELSDYLVGCLYPETIRFGFKDEGEPERDIYTLLGTKIATGYRRIIYSDYGPYLEIGKDEIIRDALQQNSGTSKEMESNVTTHLSFTSIDGMANVRFQTREGPKRAMATGGRPRSFSASKYYVSLFKICPGDLIPIEDGELMPDENHALVCQAVNCHGRYRDGISRDVSHRWPFIEEEYKELCSKYDPLSLLGTFQVVVTDNEQIEGVVNLFCDMSSGRNRRQAGMNFNSLVDAIYNACTEIPDRPFVIPYEIGCKGKEYLWPELHRKLSCRLIGKNVAIVKPKDYTPADGTPVERTEDEVLDSVAAIMAADDSDENATVTVTDAMGCAADLIEQVSAEDRPYLVEILSEMMGFNSNELRALALLLSRQAPINEEDDEA